MAGAWILKSVSAGADYKVIAFQDEDGGTAQGIILGRVLAGEFTPYTDSDKLKVEGTFSAAAPALPTLTHDRVECANNTSIEVLAANVDRVSGAMVINNTDVTFYLQVAAAAVVEQGIPLAPGATWNVNTEQQIQAIQNSGGALSLDIYEAE